MIDTHAHLDHHQFDADRSDVLERAWQAGITSIIIPAIEPDRWPAVRQLVASDSRLANGAGIHPHHAHVATEEHFGEIERWCQETSTVAVGEIGLDYYYDFCPKDIQQNVFRRQIQIAKRVNLPVIIHNRDSDDDVLRILKEEQDGTLRGVLHCFSSDVNVLHRALDLGMHVSFTGNITFRKSTLHDVITTVPEDRFMIETDAPYIAPVPHRGSRNEPSFVQHTAAFLAAARGISLDALVERTTATARALFALSIMLCIVTVGALAQPSLPNDEEFESDAAYDKAMEIYVSDSLAWAKYIKPKTFGFGFTIGSNTVVEGQQFVQRFQRGAPDKHLWSVFAPDSGPRRAFTFDGIVAIGGALTYNINERFILEAGYVYSENTGPARNFGLDPIVTRVLETAVIYNLNPYSRVNFLASGGITFAQEDNGTTTRTKFGPNGAFGLGVNVTTPFGIFYPMFNVRFNFMLQRDQDRVITRYGAIEGVDNTNPNINTPFGFDPITGQIVDPATGRRSEDRAQVSTLYSILRFTLLWYPNL